MEEIIVSIRNLQHYLYCPHRWGLINIDCSWAENYFVTKGNIIHGRVHDPDSTYVSRNKKVLTSVMVYNDDLGLYGIVDCIELTKSSKGVPIDGFSDKYQLTLVEYKPSMPDNKKFNDDDALQVFAQKVCTDKIFHCDSKGVIYYADAKKRVSLPLQEHYSLYMNKLTEVLADIRMLTYQGVIPPVRDNQKCGGCSFHDLCIPQVVSRKHFNFHEMLRRESF